MAFLRTVSGYFYLVESVRVDGKVQQKRLAYLGKPEGAIARLERLTIGEDEKQKFIEQIKPLVPIARTGESLQSFLKYAGGKGWAVSEVAPYWGLKKKKRLVEPFCGGLNVALGLAPESALLNDVNFHLINLYQQIQKGLKIDIELEPSRFMEYRNRFNAGADPYSAESAQLFYYLLRSGYGGLCRFNLDGGFNVNVAPPPKKGGILYPDITPYRAAFQGWRFTSGDFEQLEIKRSDFVYADPPYDPVPEKETDSEKKSGSKKKSFTGYFGKFDWSDQERLAVWLSKLPCPVLASNQDTDRIRHLYDSLGFTIRPIKAPRMINSSGDRSDAREVLLWKAK